jgi:hypothetical protein
MKCDVERTALSRGYTVKYFCEIYSTNYSTVTFFQYFVLKIFRGLSFHCLLEYRIEMRDDLGGMFLIQTMSAYLCLKTLLYSQYVYLQYRVLDKSYQYFIL